MSQPKSGFPGIGFGVFLFAVFSVAGTPVHAEPLSRLVGELIKTDTLVRAAEADVVGARNRARETLGAWFPALNVTGSLGYENQNQPSARDTSMVPRDVDVTVTQLLWDFGATNASVRSAGLVLDQTRAALRAERQNLLLKAVTAYLNVFRAAEVLKFAMQSEANILRQTELENALVERGAGFSTDVLQAKVQLAGAQARRVRAAGALRIARNTYREVFGTDSADPRTMTRPLLSVDLLPTEVDGVVRAALETNPTLEATQIASRIAEEDVSLTRATSFLPTLEAVAEVKYSKDVGGTVGIKREQIGKVQLTYPFNLGLTAVNSLRASESNLMATTMRYADARSLIEEQARNAWANLGTARENADLLLNQANIAGEFLEFARKERQLGRRSLIDVLNGETSLINANSDAVSAQTDVAIAFYTLLNVMGGLEVDAIRDVASANVQ